MNIRLLGDDGGFQPSPERSVYRIQKDRSTNRFIFVVPVDMCFLENDPTSPIRDGGKPRKPPSAWSRLELGVPNINKGLGKFMGAPPNILLGVLEPHIYFLGNPGFRPITLAQRKLETISKLPNFQQQLVDVGASASIGIRRAEVINIDVNFSLDFLGLSVQDLKTYQLRFFSRLAKSMIGSPVLTTDADGAWAILGMLVGIQNRSNGECDAWVYPAEKIS